MRKLLMHNACYLCLGTFLLFLAVGCSCSGNKDTHNKNEKPMAYSEIKSMYHKPLMDWNKDVVSIERDVIIKYGERRNWDLTETGTGLYYDIFHKGKGDKASVGKTAVFNYHMSLMDGTPLYSSDSLGPREILLGHTEEESGLDEAFQLMRVGDKAHLILPPHLAYGVPGDGYLIPPRSIIVYDVELIALKD